MRTFVLISFITFIRLSTPARIKDTAEPVIPVADRDYYDDVEVFDTKNIPNYNKPDIVHVPKGDGKTFIKLMDKLNDIHNLGEILKNLENLDESVQLLFDLEGRLSRFDDVIQNLQYIDSSMSKLESMNNYDEKFQHINNVIFKIHNSMEKQNKLIEKMEHKINNLSNSDKLKNSLISKMGKDINSVKQTITPKLEYMYKDLKTILYISNKPKN